MPGKAAVLQYSRKVHLYYGLLISPTLLFFAFTGAYQTLSLHEAASDYKPPAILASLGQIHKKQTYVIAVRRGPGPAANSSADGSHADRAAADQARPASGAPQPATRNSDPESTSVQSGHAGKNQEDTPHPDAGKAPDAPREGRADGSLAALGKSPNAQQPMTLAAKQRQHLPLKIFFLVVSLGLFTSTLTGIYMAYKYDRNPLLVTVLLLGGAILPLILVNF